MIRIQNIYYLFLYAWNKFIEGRQLEVGHDDSPDLPNLLAKVLLAGVNRQLRRGLDRSYIVQEDELAFPRGKFLLAETVKRSSLASGQAVCEFDELSVDTTTNRILKAAIRRLHQSPDIATEFAYELRRLEARLATVATVPLSPPLFRQLQITRNHGQYGLLTRVCHLIMELSMPDQVGHGHRFMDIRNDETRMSVVFEHFVRNFYRVEQNVFKVRAETLMWPADCPNPKDASFLPEMTTDITLRSPKRTIIIDTKYYRDTFASRFDSQKIHAHNLYQIQSYLLHSEYPAVHESPRGVLLYPSTDGQEVMLEFRLPPHCIQVWTLDLNRPWGHVHKRLLDLVDCDE